MAPAVKTIHGWSFADEAPTTLLTRESDRFVPSSAVTEPRNSRIAAAATITAAEAVHEHVISHSCVRNDEPPSGRAMASTFSYVLLF